MSDNELQKLLIDTQKQYSNSNKSKDRIIMLLIVLIFLEAVTFFSGFIWYESQFEYEEVTETKTEQTVDLSSEGDNANAEYNDIEGNQYNDNAIHNESSDD